MKLFLTFSFLWVLLFPQLAVYANTPLAGEISSKKKPDLKEGFNYDIALKTSQNVIGKRLGEYAFINAQGQSVSMSDFVGKPLVLSMVYTSCYQICPMTTRHLAKVVEKARDALGKDNFSVAVVGFDTPVDTPDAMQYFANKQGIHNKDWHLLTISAEEVQRLSKETGFIYFPSASGFDHLIQATVIDAEGKVYRQVYGQVFDTPLLIEPLKELVLGQPKMDQTFLADLTNKIKLFCTTYDPVRDGYFFDYSLFLGMLIGAVIILFTAVLIVKEWRKTSQHLDT
ncbi:MAG: SCO family protein [Gammaproteobacteria bacterium]|nr:SCO family protein [Gammaproteobacteria bacterium]